MEADGNLASILAYGTHTTGVVLRAYDSRTFRNAENKISVLSTANTKGIIEIIGNEKVLSVVGVDQETEATANDETKELLVESSYINPDSLVEAVATTSLKTDDLYYKRSRGSNPGPFFGLFLRLILMDRNRDLLL